MDGWVDGRTGMDAWVGIDDWIHICEFVQGRDRSKEPGTLEILMPLDLCHCCSYRPNQAAMYWLFPFVLSVTCVVIGPLGRNNFVVHVAFSVSSG